MPKIALYILRYPVKTYLFLKNKIRLLVECLSNYLIFNFFFFIIIFILFRLQKLLKINIFYKLPPHKFPFDDRGITGFETPLEVNKGDTYYARLYNEQLIENKKHSLSRFFFLNHRHPIKVEILNCNKIKNNIFNFVSKNDCALPISACDKDVKFKINLDNKKYEIKVPFNRFYYLRLGENEKISIENNKTFLVGKPIDLSQKSKNHTKISLGIFVDGFAALEACKVINSLEEIMP